MKNAPNVALIGAGAMGGALLRGWLESGAINASQSAVFDPAARDDIRSLCAAHGVALNPVVSETNVDAVVIAVKPQITSDVLGAFHQLAQGPIVISVMAGKSVAAVSAALGGAVMVARAMPNLPAAIGKGVTGLFAPPAIDQAGRQTIESLMVAAGETVWVDSEGAIDFVTAVSGSGPAYYFLLTEALAEAGASLGLSKDGAAQLARATLTGAGALMEQDARTPAEMREAVTSPGGTTQAALNVFDGDEKALRRLVTEAVKAAAKRAGELTE